MLAVLAILGGTWLYFNGGQTALVVDSNRSGANGSATRGPDTNADQNARGKQATNARPDTQAAVEAPHLQTPPSTDNSPYGNKPDIPAPEASAPSMSKPDAGEPQMNDAAPEPEKTIPEKPGTDKPVAQMPATQMPATERPVTDKPDAEKPKEEPLEAKATAEEAAKVGSLLKSARAALANREIVKAQDLLAEATIEATAPETTAEVGRVELLANYVEMFWDAVRQTLPKIGLEELEINGTMMAVVEADENHLIIRAEGKNYDYKWQKLPRSIAYYLANRWLAQDDPVRNLVLASFEMIDPKGDRNQAERLLDTAAAAGLKSESLQEELKRARGK